MMLVARMCLLAAIGFGVQPAAADVEILFNRSEVPGSPINWKIIDRWQSRIEYQTEGRVSFVTPVESLAPAADQLDLMASGGADGAYVFNGFLEETQPLIQLSMTPMTSGSAESSAVALWRVYERYFSDLVEFEGAELMGFVAAPPTQMWSLTRYALDDISDFDGRPVYTLAGAPASAARMLGAEPTDIGTRSTRDAFGDGVLEAALSMSATDVLTHRVLESVTSMTQVPGGVFTPTYSILLSDRVWNQISPEDQDIIRALSGEALARRSAAWDIEEYAAQIKLRELDVDIRTAQLLLEAELQDRWKQAFWESWITRAVDAGANGFAALDAYFIEIEEIAQDS